MYNDMFPYEVEDQENVDVRSYTKYSQLGSSAFSFDPPLSLDEEYRRNKSLSQINHHFIPKTSSERAIVHAARDFPTLPLDGDTYNNVQHPALKAKRRGQ